jgi:DNA-binding CsgD family transcriptional regulator
MKKAYIVFGPDTAVTNLSRLGLRYFRMGFVVDKKYHNEVAQKLSSHPNVGWVFEAKGWFTLAAGFWAKDNAEINSVSDSIRRMFSGKVEVAFQSELTALYCFGNRPVTLEKTVMTMIDPHEQAIHLSPLEIDYMKLVTLSFEYSSAEVARILGIRVSEAKNLEKSMYNRGVISGIQKRINYRKNYIKIFIDTASAKKGVNVEDVLEDIWSDNNCTYFCKSNSKYNFEIELVTDDKRQIDKYKNLFKDTKVSVLTKNVYTNLYPINKVANVKEIQDAFINQKGNVVNLSNSKLWYLNYKSAEAYLDVYENKEYYEVMEKDELDLFPKIARDILKKYPDYRFELIDIGSGNGMKAKYFIDALGAKNVKTYYPVDIQPVELEAAKLVHRDALYGIKEVVLNFEKFDTRFPLKTIPGIKRIYCFFGGTYGNFKSHVINGYLKHTDDILLVAMPSVIENQSKSQIEHSYTNEILEQMAFGVLAQVGFSKKDFKNNPKYQGLIIHSDIEEDSRNIVSFYLKNDTAVGGHIYKKGTRFTITTSWKPTLKEFDNALSKDFDVTKIYNNKNMAIAMIER